MNSEHIYTPDSWQFVTTQVKEALGIKELSKSQASILMKLYILGLPTEKIIVQLEADNAYR